LHDLSLLWIGLMKTTIAILTLCFAGAAWALAADSSAGRAGIRFTFENPQLEPSAYSLEIFEDGSGSYTTSVGVGSDSQPEVRAIQIHDPLRSKLFEAARADHFFAIACEAPHDKVAFTGKKTLAYTGPDGTGSCTFNYSREQSVNQIASDLIGVAYTLEEGERLKSEHLHDRLSLDSELESLETAAQEHRALELGNIAPELESIANDDAVLERARRRARTLVSEPETIR
jgi:hypothetical protein